MGKTVTQFKSIGDSTAIDRTTSNFENADQKVAKIKRLVNKGEFDKDVARYITGVLNLMFQGKLENTTTKEQPADSSYNDRQNLEFRLMLTQNYNTNPNSFHLCFPNKIKKNPTLVMT